MWLMAPLCRLLGETLGNRHPNKAYLRMPQMGWPQCQVDSKLDGPQAQTPFV